MTGIMHGDCIISRLFQLQCGLRLRVFPIISAGLTTARLSRKSSSRHEHECKRGRAQCQCGNGKRAYTACVSAYFDRQGAYVRPSSKAATAKFSMPAICQGGTHVLHPRGIRGTGYRQARALLAPRFGAFGAEISTSPETYSSSEAWAPCVRVGRTVVKALLIA